MKQVKQHMEIKARRIFSEAVKKRAVKDLVEKRTTIRALTREHLVCPQTIYNWLYKYSPLHQSKCTLVVQMESEEQKNHDLRQRIADLERIVGQKQLELDFLNKLLEVGSNELGFDLKKSFSSPSSSGTGATSSGMDTS